MSSANRRAIDWQVASVKAVRRETPRVVTFTLTLPYPTPHRAGQHYDIRLTAPDGYQAQRSYSVASEPERTGEIDLTVERIEDGEVSTYLHDVLVPGDQIEVRGPIGGYFVWEASLGGPLLLVAGGSGIAPLMSMIRHRCAAGSTVPTRLLYSARTYDDIIYRQELNHLQHTQSGLEIIYTLTRAQPPGWAGYARRIDAAMLSEVAAPLLELAKGSLRTYVCGPTMMVETTAGALFAAGIPAEQIRTERFGPTGG